MTFKTIGIFLLAAIAVVGCNKQLSDTLYDTQTLDGNVNTTADVLKIIQGTYGNFQSTDLYKKELLKLLTITADDMQASTTEFQLYSAKTYDATSSSISIVYSGYYNIINNCNFLLAKLPNIKTTSGTDSTLKVREEGTIRFFRAFCYLDLVRLFGGVPLRTNPTDINSNFYTTRASVDSVYSLILSDLNRADSILVYKSSSDGIGLTNKGAAFALNAIANLTYANYLDRNGGSGLVNYKKASACADTVIQKGGYKLISNYADLWDIDNESNAYGTEVIFGIRFTRDNVVSGSNSQGSDLPSRFMPTTMGGVTGAPKTGNVAGIGGAGSGTYRVMPWFYDYFTSGDYAGDYRSETTFLTSWPKTPGSGTIYVSYPTKPSNKIDTLPSQFPFVKKYIDGKAWESSNHENDMFLIRLAEIYLVRAEAQNEINGGPTTAALADFNQLRARARAANNITTRTTPADLKITGLLKDDFRKKILDERGLEFIGEGKRWFDLVRMKGINGAATMYQYQYQTFLPTVPSGPPVYNFTTKVWGGGKTDLFSVVPYNSKYLLFPIPQVERDLNNALTQNPGW